MGHLPVVVLNLSKCLAVASAAALDNIKNFAIYSSLPIATNSVIVNSEQRISFSLFLLSLR